MELTHTNGKVEAPKRERAVYVPLVKADQATLQKIWPLVRSGCLAIKAKDRHHDIATWDVTHVRSQLDLTFVGKGTAELWRIMAPWGEMVGFIVTIVGNCPYKQTPQSLIMWISYMFPRGKDEKPIGAFRLVPAISRQLAQHACELGLEYVDGYSMNQKWLKYLMRTEPKARIAQFMFRMPVY